MTTDRMMRAALAMAASFGILLALFGTVGAKAQAFQFDLALELSAGQREFVESCREGGFYSKDQLKECIRLGSSGEIAHIANAWGNACGRTYDRIRATQFTLVDLGFYNKVCEGHQPAQ